MANVAIPYFSANGHTHALAEHIAGGLGEADCSARLIDVTQMGDLDWQAMEASDVILFGTPTYMGSASAEFKLFMDRSSDLWVDRLWADKLAGGFTVATYPSGDKLSTLMQLSVFAAQHGMLWVGQDLVGAPVNAAAEGTNQTGAWLGLAAQSARGAGALIAPEDLETARLFGHRIARAAHRWVG
ncbi:MAG: flavodoxin family protein [Thalassovita sp.]